MAATKGSASAAPIYEDFVPTSELVSDEECDTLLIHLPGFKKEQLRVQLTKGILRISGSMPVEYNKMRRFQKEFPVSPNCNTNKISARFETGILHVKQPKLITPATTTSVKTEQHKLPLPPTQTPSLVPQEPKKPAMEPKSTHSVAEETIVKKQGKETGEGSMAKLTRNENDGEKKDKVASGKEYGGVNSRIENYRKMVGAMGKRMKMQRRVLNIVLASLFTCIVAIYVNNLITSFRQPKNSN